MPQISYLVRQQVTARLADPDTGFNVWLAAACASQSPEPVPYEINFQAGSADFWTSYCTSEDLDKSSSPDDGTLCIIYTLAMRNMQGTVQKFAVFSGTVDIAVAFDIAWPESFIPPDTEGICDATDDAMIKTFNTTAYYPDYGSGVIYNGDIDDDRGPLRESGPGWRQRLTYRLHFEVQA